METSSRTFTTDWEVYSLLFPSFMAVVFAQQYCSGGRGHGSGGFAAARVGLGLGLGAGAHRTGGGVTASHTLPGDVRPWGNHRAHSEYGTLFEKFGL